MYLDSNSKIRAKCTVNCLKERVQIEKKGKEGKVVRGYFSQIKLFSYFDQLYEEVKETMSHNYRTP